MHYSYNNICVNIKLDNFLLFAYWVDENNIGLNYTHEANCMRNFTLKINLINNTMQDVAQKKMSLEEMLECARMFKSSAGKIICQSMYQKKFAHEKNTYISKWLTAFNIL